MGTEIFLVAVVLLLGFAILDLVVGVSNDAVNFLNSSLGSGVAPRRVIMIIASVGILAGVLFSSGMMEVARKGIFHPQLFTMPELMIIFVAVMITDVILLDLFNTFGLPTSTTVSIVFELLGAAVAVSCLKIIDVGEDLANLGHYINSGKAMLIISGILLSVAISFIFGALFQFLTRLLFGFDYEKRLKRYGALWGGMAMSSITYFILIKGAKGATFLSKSDSAWIKGNAALILLAIFVVSAIALRIVQTRKGNILKPIVLVGTFALALAFAANDLVNFIGVPLAGLHAYTSAVATTAPLSAPMEALAGKVQSQNYLLLIAGAIMIGTLWMSRKARSVTDTEIGLGAQEEGRERFESTLLSRAIVRMARGLGASFSSVIPARLRAAIDTRMDASRYGTDGGGSGPPPFDLIRASVNLMVASAVVSYASSQKLPLSTTYVTFMVAMGTSFADGAWGRETAVYRVTGVLTVIGGWFMTALMAFSFASIFALILWHGRAYGGIGLLGLAGFMLWRNHHQHRSRSADKKQDEIFDIKRVEDPHLATATSFHHVAHLVRSIRDSLDLTLEGLFNENEDVLRKERRRNRQIQLWTNVIIANVFKAMRLIQRQDNETNHGYAPVIRRIQKLADGHRDLVLRAHQHVSNHHTGLLPEQIEDLQQVRELLGQILTSVEAAFDGGGVEHQQMLLEKDQELRALSKELNARQVLRIQDGSSKTRLSILHYAVIGNARMLSKQLVRMMEIFKTSFGDPKDAAPFDLD